jgi:hypothetical protein
MTTQNKKQLTWTITPTALRSGTSGDVAGTKLPAAKTGLTKQQAAGVAKRLRGYELEITDSDGGCWVIKGGRLVRGESAKIELSSEQQAKLDDARLRRDLRTDREQVGADRNPLDVLDLEDLGDYSRSYDVYGSPADPASATEGNRRSKF